MEKQVAVVAALAIGLMVAQPAQAARVYVGIGGGGYYPGYYGGGYYGRGWGPAYYPGYYVAPPPVIYAEPEIAPPVVYAPPTAYAPPTYYQQQPAPAAAPAPAPTGGTNPTSATFTDTQGRTCRHYQVASSNGPTYGTSCLANDGTWQTVQ